VLRTGVDTWLAERRAQGWQAEAEILGGGFPASLVANLQDVALADPGTGVALEASVLRFDARAWWPGYAQLALPPDPITLAAPDGSVDLLMDQGVFELDIAPSTLLELSALSWTSGPWGLTQAQDSFLSADSLTLSMDRKDEPVTYAFKVDADTLTPGSHLRERLKLPDDWPLAFETFSADMQVRFDRPWDIRALEDRRPQPRFIELRKAEAQWGDMQLRLATTLEIDEAGQPKGDIRIQARNWKAMLALAETSGVLPPQLRPQVESILSSLARATGNPDTLDARLRADGGVLWMGFVPLGPAPRITLR
jgi:hypothetical protein